MIFSLDLQSYDKPKPLKIWFANVNIFIICMHVENDLSLNFLFLPNQSSAVISVFISTCDSHFKKVMPGTDVLKVNLKAEIKSFKRFQKFLFLYISPYTFLLESISLLAHSWHLSWRSENPSVKVHMDILCTNRPVCFWKSSEWMMPGYLLFLNFSLRNTIRI